MPTKILWVGDPHVEPHDLQDAAALCRLVINTAEEHGAMVVLAGDLYHTHAIIHAEVLFFWHLFFDGLRRRDISSLVIKGNHDAPGTEGSKATALLAHVEQATMVLHKPYARHGLLFCPYTHDPAQLIRWSEAHPECKTLLCHATFDGSMYDNGFFVPEGEGVRVGAIVQPEIISGHIHRPQRYDRVWYPGAPRWKTLSDANLERAIWLLNFDDAGILQDRTPVDTGKVCRRIYHLIDTPDEPCNVLASTRHEYRVDSHGPAAWLETRKPVFAGWARWRGVKTDARSITPIKESEGVAVAFSKWLEVFKPRYGTERAVLEQMVKERIHAF